YLFIEVHLAGILESVQGLLLLVHVEIRLRQVVVCILGHCILSIYDLIELTDGVGVIALLVIGVTQLVVIGVVPLPGSTFVFLKIWNSLYIPAKVEITLPDDLVKLGDLIPVGIWKLCFC